MYCVAVTFKMAEQVEQGIYIKFCVKLEHSSAETIQMTQKASYGQLVIGSFITTNVPAHASCLLQSFLAKHQITQVTQLLYNPDSAPCDFWLFPKLKSPLKGKRFQTINEIQENTTEQLMASPAKDSVECIEQWKRHWKNCVRSPGACSEGD